MTLALTSIVGATVFVMPSMVSSGLPLPVAVLSPLVLVSAIGWGLASSDPSMEMTAARDVRAFDALLVASLAGVVVLACLLVAFTTGSDAGSIAARATIMLVGLLLWARMVVTPDAAALMPIGYVIVCAFLAGPTQASMSAWAAVMRPADDRLSWAIAVATLVSGLMILARGPQLRRSDAADMSA